MSLVTFVEVGHVAVVTLNRPDVRNAINADMAQALGDAVDRVEADDNLKVAVLAAATTEPRPVFCAGDDLRAIGHSSPTTPRGGFAGFVNYPRTKPFIAAVDGLATSGGCELVLACDLVVATRRSSFAVAEVKWGLAALAGGLIRLPRLLGRAPAMDMILTGEPVTAERAHQLGLVSTLVDGDVVTAARERAEVIARFDSETVRINFDAANRAITAGEAELWAANQETRDAIFASPALQAGLRAFERRSP